MSVESALRRWEQILRDRFPEYLAAMRPGLDDAGVDSLRQSLAPLGLPGAVESLYRWRDGGRLGVFAGWRLRPVEDLLEWRRFSLDVEDEPPAWLHLFDDRMSGFVTLDVPGEPASDPSVWYMHSHEPDVRRLFDSIESMIDVCILAADAGRIVDRSGRMGLDVDPSTTHGPDERTWDGLRLERCPGSWQWPEPPAGTEFSRWPQAQWPRPWLVSLGAEPDAARLRGATSTIGELIAAARQGPAAGTIRGRVTQGQFGRTSSALVEDGTGRLMVVVDPRQTIFPGVGVGRSAEYDVVLPSDDVPPLAEDPDPLVQHLVRKWQPQVPTAYALAVRPIP